MTERGLPSTEGSPACPFVAFDDDRDARSDRPDHRHRCFAEADPAPRALAHQEAYCLSSAFPVCPTFQAWARREAAQARHDRDAAAGAAATAAAAGASTGGSGSEHSDGPGGPTGGPGTADVTPGPEAVEWTHGADDIPIESRPRRNPPRDWAAPPPWASGSGGSRNPGGGAGSSGAGHPGSSIPGGSPGGPPATAPGFLTPRPVEGQGLAGSAADRLASGGSIVDPAPHAAAPPNRSGDLPSAGPDAELAGLVGGAALGASSGGAGRSGVPMTDEERMTAGYPPPTRGGRRPAVSSTRTDRDRDRERAPHREHVQSSGPSWERARRYEAYPTIKTRAGLGGLPALPRVAVLAAALGAAALALFFLPALLGIGGGDEDASPSPSSTQAAVTPLPSPTPEPEPTPQIYVIKTGDTLSAIAREFGITLDQLLEANRDTIEDPNKISVGDEIIIPAPPPDEIEGGTGEPDASVTP